jgi:hypothetical protein
MKKNFVWGALAIATATAIGGSYQIFAQTSTTSPLERQGSKREPGVTRYVEERVIPPNAAAQQGFSMGTTFQQGMPLAIDMRGSGPDNQLYRRVMNPNHFETVIIEDGKVKVISSNEPLDEETRAKSNEARKQLDDAIRTFRSEDASDQDRAKARTTLSSYLTAQFDHDQEMRRKQIKSLEEEVDKLKKQIAKREESKDKLVELRLTLLENDANGLAFPPAFNQIPGANGPGFPRPSITTYERPYDGQSYSMPNLRFGAESTINGWSVPGTLPATPVDIIPRYPNNSGYPAPPNPPAPGPKLPNR